MKSVIVTGANGFIGTNLLQLLDKNGVKIYAIVKDEKEDITQIDSLSNVEIIYCELDHISKLPDLIADRDIDCCIHLAWAGSSGEARADYALQLLNVKYALDTVKAVAQMGVKRFVGAGTLAEKDVLNYHPTDGATPNAVSIYGIAKISMHFMTKAYCTKMGVEHIWCYLSNTYGVGNTTNNFVNMASRKMLRRERASFTAGEQLYDFVYVSDTVNALFLAASKGKKNTAYYLGSTAPRKLKEYIEIIRDNIDPEIPLHLGEIPYNGIPLAPDDYNATKLVADTGYQPEISFEEGIAQTVEWLKTLEGKQEIIPVNAIPITKVVITGADGFVGSHTVEYFLQKGTEVVALDMAEKPKRLKANSGLKYAQCDVSDLQKLEDILKHENCDAFIHFAWAGSAGEARCDYHLQMQNALNTVECLKVAKRVGCSRFICAGSIMEYEVEAAVHTQESRPGMGYIYGMGKQIAHNMCKAIASRIGIDLLWPMITNAYGIGEFSPRFVNTTLRRIINSEPLKFTAATQNYDFVYVTDVAKAFYLITTKGKPFCEYMIGSGHPRPLKEFILEMVESCNPEAVPIFGDIPYTGTNVPLQVFSTADLETDCGYVPEVSFGDGTKMTMEWLKSIS